MTRPVNRPLTRRTSGVRLLGTAALLLAVVPVLGGCAKGDLMEPEHDPHRTVAPDAAKRSIVDVVDETATTVEGDWKVVSGPRLGLCPGSNGSGDADDEGGITWVYMREREAAGDPRDDLRTVEKLWRGLGITTERFRSGGDDPDLGLRGHGGPVSSIVFTATSRGSYTIDGESQCADADHGDLATSTPAP